MKGEVDRTGGSPPRPRPAHSPSASSPSSRPMRGGSKKGKRTVSYSDYLRPKDAVGKTRGAYTSKAYDATKRNAIRAGLSDHDAVLVAREAFAAATAVWIKVNNAGSNKALRCRFLCSDRQWAIATADVAASSATHRGLVCIGYEAHPREHVVARAHRQNSQLAHVPPACTSANSKTPSASTPRPSSS
eukprot:9070285-Pyramimonas_sp.AAC.2